MSNKRTLFRLILLAGILCPLLSAALFFWNIESMPEGLIAYRTPIETVEQLDIKMMILAALSLLVLILVPVNLIGLWLFKHWARTLYLVLTIFSFFVMPFLGPLIMGAWEATFFQAGIFISGSLLALMFASKVAEEFALGRT